MKKILFFGFIFLALFSSVAFCMSIVNLLPVLEQAKRNITNELNVLDRELAQAAGDLSKTGFKGEGALKILANLCKDKDYVVTCSIIDNTGKMVLVQPDEFRKNEGTDISKQPHIVAIKKDKKPMLTNVFTAIEGVQAVVFEYPIFTSDKKFAGSVNLLINPGAFCDDMVLPLVKDIPCKIWIMQKDGLIIFDPDPNQVGRNIFTDSFFQPFEDMISFARTVSLSKDGAGSYDFYAKGLEDKTIVKKYAVWDTAGLYGTQWRVVAMEAQRLVPKKTLPLE